MNRKFVSIVGACVVGGSLYAQTASSQASTSDLSRPFEKVFQQYVDDHTIPGAVFLVATKDKVLDEETIGYSDLATHRPMSLNQEFWIASMTKTFTATALMMLVDEGKVSINDPVEKYLPEFKGMVVKTPAGPVPANHPILIREVLSHTSGMVNTHPDYEKPLSERVKVYAKTPLENQPGTTFTYVDVGLNTIGRIIEVVSGEPYEDFIQQRILTPLGMKDTTFWPNKEQIARLATGYQANAQGDGLTSVPTPFISQEGKRPRAFPAGGLFSTADDLLKYCRMLLNGGTYEGQRYISQSSIDLMTKQYTTPETGGSYGLGWMITPNTFGHDGAWKTRMTIEPRDGLVEIFLVQLAKPFVHDGNHIQNVFTATADKTFREQHEPPTPVH